MFDDIQNLILLIVFVVIGVIIFICCIYCCACKPACANARRRIIRGQIARDEEAIERERETSRNEIRETLSANEQTRNEIRNKYNLRK
ncbi:hypothetical protein I4U23_000434 [Adineta vaga]|nr:hypothetical protein I4U23_000434 [Adineta vaga]